jgi:hypothetical protein
VTPLFQYNGGVPAKDHLNKTLFHGSAHKFEVGDTVNPGEDQVAWASTNPAVAAEYGPTVYKVSPIDDLTKHPGASKESGIHYSKAGYHVMGVHPTQT